MFDLFGRSREGRFGVSRRAFTDPEFFELELRIFEATSVYLEHESQLKRPGDFRRSCARTRPSEAWR